MAGKYSHMDGLAGFGFLINALDGSFQRSDAEDLGCGARFIPGEVTLARQYGGRVQFVHDCGPCCWYWEMPDGSRIYHWDPVEAQRLGDGPCPRCQNRHVKGGKVSANKA